MVLVEVSGVPVQAGAAPAGTPTVLVEGAVVQAATPLAITPAVALEDVGLQAANAVASTGANSVGPMTRSAEQAIDEAQVRLGEASARMGDEQHACGICIDRPRAVRSLPCGHGGLCELCTIELVLQAVPRGPNCVYCRCTVSRLMVVPVTTATAGEGQVLPRRMPTNQAVPEPQGRVFESIEEFLLAMLDSADAEVANAARTALARRSGQGAASASEERGTETVTTPLEATSLDVNAADADGWTALMRAAGRGHTDRVTALLAAPGLDVNAADGDGWTALIWAANGGHAETVTALLAAPRLSVNAADRRDGWTALMWAAGRGHAETVTALLAAPGLDVNAANAHGYIYGQSPPPSQTALMRAVDGGHAEVVTALLAAPYLDVNTAHGGGWTVLMKAAHGGHAETVTALLAAPGLNVNAADCNGWTALMRAADRGHAETVTALLAAPGLDVNAAARSGRTALGFAEARGHVEIASLLRAAGAYALAATPVVVARTYVRAQSRELARGVGSLQRGIVRQLSGGTSSTAAARAFDAGAKVQCAQCKGAKKVDGATAVHDTPIESRARRACSLTFWASWRRRVATIGTRRRTR